MMFDGQEWVYVGERGFSNGAANYVTIDFDSNGNPYLGFQDEIENNEVTVTSAAKYWFVRSELFKY